MKNIILFITILVSQVAFSQQVIITPDKKEKIKTYVNHFEENNQLMGTISIMQNGKEVINKTFGEINKKESNLLSERKYTIGSITKLFTAVLYAKLLEAGKISFEDKLNVYFPNIPNSDKIQIKHMLNHTSGLKNYVSKSDSLHFWLKKPRTEKEILDEIIMQGVSFQPRDSLSYSNSAYYLLGKILEKKYKKPFEQILTNEITTPLNLTNTVALSEGSSHNNVAKSYEKKNGKWVEMEEFYFPNAYSAGYIATTASDMNNFLNALFNYKIIKKETLQSMLPKENDWFGLGIMKAPFYEYIGYGHGGDTYGTHSVATYTMENKLAVTYIINGENYPTNDFAIGLLSIVYDKEYALPNFKEYTPDKKFYEAYSGTYGSDKLPIKIKIYAEDSVLKAEGEGQPAFTLNPVEKHIFDFKKAGIELEFDPYQEKMLLKQAGQEFEMTKE
jgi:D-alanyl-D-alanine carboxypeptidase